MKSREIHTKIIAVMPKGIRLLRKWTVFMLCVFSLAAAPAAADTGSGTDGGYLICFREGCDINTEGMEQIRGNLYQLNDISLLRGRRADIEYIEKNEPVEAPEFQPEESALPAAVSDPWQVVMVNPDSAWNWNTYGQNIKVAVIDSGCSRHAQLEDVLCGGWNFVSKNNDYSDANGHGTNVAGILAASAGSWVTGIAPKVELYALRCWEDGKVSSISTLTAAVYAAVDDFGCQVINMSFVTMTDSETLHDALNYASQKGVILVAAAGNTGDDTAGYPGAYPEVISVASVGAEKAVSSFSSFNRNVFVSAPGESYISCYSENGYSIFSGTSQACPVVSGAAALMLSMDPELTEPQFRQLIADTAEDLMTEGRDDHTGYGLLNISAMAEKLLEDCDVYVSPVDKNTGKAVLYNLSSAAEKLILFRSREIRGRYCSGSLSCVELESGKSSPLSLSGWSAGEILHVFGGPDGFMPVAERKYS